MSPEPDSVLLARVDERVKTLTDRLDTIDTRLEGQGRTLGTMRTDLASVKSTVEGHAHAEGDKWDEHEKRHDADARRFYAVVGFCMTGLVIITSLIVHFL